MNISINFKTVPIFEVKNGDSRMSIYADGRIEGFPKGYTQVINRIPIYVDNECKEAVDAALEEK